MLAASRGKAWVRLRFEVEVEGREAEALNAAIRTRELLWGVRRPLNRRKEGVPAGEAEANERGGFPGCDGCDQGTVCLRCQYCAKLGKTPQEVFEDPPVPTATTAECDADIHNARENGILPKDSCT